ncbi:conserved hypothetical protein [Ricinus communis]|uniref:Uncharacterized protein n=1 Tax=Ricinus communis TaxID=3988 RepID=B9RPJ8_RICCO|nr:conserved hypothetical protein [Ricinus communis]
MQSCMGQQHTSRWANSKQPSAGCGTHNNTSLFARYGARLRDRSNHAQAIERGASVGHGTRDTTMKPQGGESAIFQQTWVNFEQN